MLVAMVMNQNYAQSVRGKWTGMRPMFPATLRNLNYAHNASRKLTRIWLMLLVLLGNVNYAQSVSRKNEVNAAMLRASELRTSCELEMDGANAVALKVRFTHQL